MPFRLAPNRTKAEAVDFASSDFPTEFQTHEIGKRFEDFKKILTEHVPGGDALAAASALSPWKP